MISNKLPDCKKPKVLKGAAILNPAQIFLRNALRIHKTGTEKIQYLLLTYVVNRYLMLAGLWMDVF